MVSRSCNTIQSVITFLLGSVRLCEQQMKLFNEKRKKKKVEETESDDNEEDDVSNNKDSSDPNDEESSESGGECLQIDEQEESCINIYISDLFNM